MKKKKLWSAMLAMNLIATTSVGFTRREDDDGQAAGIMTGNRRVRIRNYY